MIKGFETLVEKEWLSFGHKFADRNGQTGIDADQSLIFLQWLDCVNQLAIQFPTTFEFSSVYLMKLAHHYYTRLFGTFLANFEQEREEERQGSQALPVWLLLERYVNVLYSNNEAILYPKCSIRSMCHGVISTLKWTPVQPHQDLTFSLRTVVMPLPPKLSFTAAITS